VPYAYKPRNLVFPYLEVSYGPGNSTVYPLGDYSPGFNSWSKPEPVRRQKPSNLREFSSLTPWGTHERSSLVMKPVSIMYPMVGGGYVRYVDIDPRTYATCGQVFGEPDVDWQTALRLAVKDQKVNLAQTLAEYKQAQNMFASNATAIAKSLSALRRGDLESVFKHLKAKPKQLRGTTANRWLELQYGWMPLLHDIHGLVEELNLSLTRPRTRKITVRKSSERREQSTTVIYVPNATRATLDFGWKVSKKVVAYMQQDSLTASRLGFTNPVNLAWELLPYSFVIDWLIPIGDWLNSLDASVGLIGIYGTVSTRAKAIGTQTYGSQHYLYEYYTRSVFQGLPNAPLPEYKPSLGLKQIANALALLSQLKR
jgi:hypothetical protein